MLQIRKYVLLDSRKPNSVFHSFLHRLHAQKFNSPEVFGVDMPRSAQVYAFGKQQPKDGVFMLVVWALEREGVREEAVGVRRFLLALTGHNIAGDVSEGMRPLGTCRVLATATDPEQRWEGPDGQHHTFHCFELAD